MKLLVFQILVGEDCWMVLGFLLYHTHNVYVVTFAVVLFSQSSRVRPRENVHFNLCLFINENIRKIMKLTPREFPRLVQNRENI